MKFNEDVFNTLVPIMKECGLTESVYVAHSGGLEFYKSKEESDHRVFLDLGVKVKGFVSIYSKISFQSVIDVLDKLDELRPNMYEAILVNYDLLGDKIYWKRVLDEFEGFSLKKQREVEKFKQRVVDHVEQDILPFFEKFPNVESVNELILSKMKFEEFPNYIPGDCTLKSMIIMKMFDNPRLKEYQEVKDKEYKCFVDQNSRMWQPAYDSFLKMSKHLAIT